MPPPGRPVGSSGISIPFTDEDSHHLAEFLASENPGEKGRKSRKLYERLVENDIKWPWASRHTAESWHGHHKRHADSLDRMVKKIIKGSYKGKLFQTNLKTANRASTSAIIIPDESDNDLYSDVEYMGTQTPSVPNPPPQRPAPSTSRAKPPQPSQMAPPPPPPPRPPTRLQPLQPLPLPPHHQFQPQSQSQSNRAAASPEKRHLSPAIAHIRESTVPSSEIAPDEQLDELEEDQLEHFPLPPRVLPPPPPFTETPTKGRDSDHERQQTPTPSPRGIGISSLFRTIQSSIQAVTSSSPARDIAVAASSADELTSRSNPTQEPPSAQPREEEDDDDMYVDDPPSTSTSAAPPMQNGNSSEAEKRIPTATTEVETTKINVQAPTPPESREPSESDQHRFVVDTSVAGAGESQRQETTSPQSPAPTSAQPPRNTKTPTPDPSSLPLPPTTPSPPAPSQAPPPPSHHHQEEEETFHLRLTLTPPREISVFSSARTQHRIEQLVPGPSSPQGYSHKRKFSRTDEDAYEDTGNLVLKGYKRRSDVWPPVRGVRNGGPKDLEVVWHERSPKHKKSNSLSGPASKRVQQLRGTQQTLVTSSSAPESLSSTNRTLPKHLPQSMSEPKRRPDTFDIGGSAPTGQANLFSGYPSRKSFPPTRPTESNRYILSGPSSSKPRPKPTVRSSPSSEAEVEHDVDGFFAPSRQEEAGPSSRPFDDTPPSSRIRTRHSRASDPALYRSQDQQPQARPRKSLPSALISGHKLPSSILSDRRRTFAGFPGPSHLPHIDLRTELKRVVSNRQYSPPYHHPHISWRPSPDKKAAATRSRSKPSLPTTPASNANPPTTPHSPTPWSSPSSNISTLDSRRVMAAGISSVLATISANRGFLPEVVAQTWMQVGDLEKTDEVLAAMQAGAKEAKRAVLRGEAEVEEESEEEEEEERKVGMLYSSRSPESVGERRVEEMSSPAMRRAKYWSDIRKSLPTFD